MPTRDTLTVNQIQLLKPAWFIGRTDQAFTGGNAIRPAHTNLLTPMLLVVEDLSIDMTSFCEGPGVTIQPNAEGGRWRRRDPIYRRMTGFVGIG